VRGCHFRRRLVPVTIILLAFSGGKYDAIGIRNASKKTRKFQNKNSKCNDGTFTVAQHRNFHSSHLPKSHAP
jgi:hypothetical protein